MKAELRCELEGRAVAVIFSNNDSVSGNLWPDIQGLQ
jgi:hypothetical protein